MSPQDTLNHHLQAFGAGDLDGILSDFTEDSVLLTNDGALRGLKEIRPFFQAMLAEFAKPGASFTLGQNLVDGDTVFITWSAESADNVYELGTDTFIVKNGKIATQTFAAKTTPKS